PKYTLAVTKYILQKINLKLWSKNYQSQFYPKDTLCLNNWYSSPNLLVSLPNSKTNATGTVRANRKSMPKDFLKTKFKKRQYEMRNYNGVLAIKWKDKQEIFILSTEHTRIAMTEQIKNQCNPTWKPKCAIKYNKGMIGVNRKDQMLACFPLMRVYEGVSQNFLLPV
ncbi:hypothetical protein AAG570_006583, partial [Ranatra chinensis]